MSEENKIPEEIKKFVDELKDLKTEEDIVKKLQEILEALLKETELRFSSEDKKTVYVKPLEIEAYYYNEGVFEDECVHVHKLQKNRQGKIYIHRYKSKAGESKALRYINRAGMDLVLSNSDKYALAVLVRDAKIYTKSGTGEKDICCSGVGSHPAILLMTLLKEFGKDFDYEKLSESPKSELSEIEGIEDKVVLFECENKGEVAPPSKRKNIYMSKSKQNDEKAEKFKNLELRAIFKKA